MGTGDTQSMMLFDNCSIYGYNKTTINHGPAVIAENLLQKRQS